MPVMPRGKDASGSVPPVASVPPATVPAKSPRFAIPSPVSSSAKPSASALSALLQQSWVAYRQQFIQADGRVIDREANDRSTSEGQAYTMLRAVVIGDRDTFDRVLGWAENNLKRQTNGTPTDSLWAWHWGKKSQNEWLILDNNFASDADIDAITALILAARRWQHQPYLRLAQTKLRDLWNLSTVTTANSGVPSHRYLLPGPAIAFQKQTTLQLNPSYFSPACFRLFAQVDSEHAWLSLVDSSYQVLEKAAALSKVGLPNDWLLLDLNTGAVQPLTVSNPGTSDYGFDAYRIWWRVATDWEWFREPRARAFLQKSLRYPRQIWTAQQKIPARIDLKGNPLAAYEATSQYGMLYFAFRLLDPVIAQQIRQKKLDPQYHNGFWDNHSAYYTQNLVWFGLMPADIVSSLLKPKVAN